MLTHICFMQIFIGTAHSTHRLLLSERGACFEPQIRKPNCQHLIVLPGKAAWALVLSAHCHAKTQVVISQWSLMIFELNRPADGDHAAISQIAPPGPAKLKVVDPLATMGPSSAAEILSSSDRVLRMRVTRNILVGSKVQVRTSSRIIFGEVLSMTPVERAYEIVVDVERA